MAFCLLVSGWQTGQLARGKCMAIEFSLNGKTVSLDVEPGHSVRVCQAGVATLQ